MHVRALFLSLLFVTVAACSAARGPSNVPAGGAVGVHPSTICDGIGTTPTCPRR